MRLIDADELYLDLQEAGTDKKILRAIDAQPTVCATEYTKYWAQHTDQQPSALMMMETRKWLNKYENLKLGKGGRR